MRKYEQLLLVKPELNQEEIDSLLGKIKENIVQNDGEIIEAKLWKRSKLAYKIQHFKQGVYLLTLFKISPKNLEKLKRFCELNQEIVRFLYIRRSNEDAT